jgi:hypothetical protein
MTNINMFSAMLSWKLKHGSHEFPGPDGGTCINEAAIIAAGLPYRRVTEANDLPECFSRPIGKFALVLNDVMPSRIRQRLMMPLVLRLAGTADNEAVEDVRSAFIITQCVRTVLTMGLNPDSEYLLNFNDVLSHPAAHLVYYAQWMECQATLPAGQIEQACELLSMAQAIRSEGDRFTAAALADCINLVAKTSRKPTKVFRRAVEILNRAIQMGCHRDVPVEQASARLQAAREPASSELEHTSACV